MSQPEEWPAVRVPWTEYLSRASVREFWHSVIRNDYRVHGPAITRWQNLPWRRLRLWKSIVEWDYTEAHFPERFEYVLLEPKPGVHPGPYAHGTGPLFDDGSSTTP